MVVNGGEGSSCDAIRVDGMSHASTAACIYIGEAFVVLCAVCGAGVLCAVASVARLLSGVACICVKCTWCARSSLVPSCAS